MHLSLTVHHHAQYTTGFAMKLNDINKIGFTLREKIMWAATVIALLFAFAISLYYANFTYMSMIEKGEEFVEQRSMYMEQKILETFNAKFELLEYIATLPEIRCMDTDTQINYLSDKSEATGLKYLFVVDLQKSRHYVAGTEHNDNHSDDFWDAVWVNDRFISDPFTLPDTDDPITTICVSIFDYDGRKVGVLCGALSLKQLYDEISTMYKAGISAAITSTGEYVLYRDVSYIIKKDNALETFANSPEITAFIQRSFNNETTLSDVIKYDDKTYFAAMTDLPYCHWKVVYALEDYFVMNGVWGLFNLHIFSIVMILMAVILIFRHQINAKNAKTMAYIDKLTGLGNAQRCHEMLNTFDESHDTIMLVCFDLNKFKEINDSLGHQAGDEALISFSRCLARSFGVTGFVGRIGGDEFISLLAGDVEMKFDGALKLLEKELEKCNTAPQAKFVLSVSYGYSIRKKDDDSDKSINSMYLEADKNMYKLKEEYHQKNRGSKNISP